MTGAALGIADGAALGTALGIAVVVSGVEGAALGMAEGVAEGMSGIEDADGVGGMSAGGLGSPPQATKKPTAAVTAKGARTKSLMVRIVLFSPDDALGEGRPIGNAVYPLIARLTTKKQRALVWCTFMIGRLTGRIIAEDEDGAIVVDVGGVGYEVVTPLGTRGRARVENDITTLFIHTHVREDVFSLFGFATEVDRTAFRTLIGVSSVGPKTAVAVLSALPGPELGRVIARKELSRLTAISGIGKKTAERLLLELEGKLTTTDTREPGAAPLAPAVRKGEGDKGELLHGALTRMGYRREEADRAVKALEDQIAEGSLADLLKEALVVLSR